MALSLEAVHGAEVPSGRSGVGVGESVGEEEEEAMEEEDEAEDELELGVEEEEACWLFVLITAGISALRNIKCE